MSLIKFFQSLEESGIQDGVIIILPTEETADIRKLVDEEFPTHSRKLFKIKVFEVPKDIYHLYGNRINELCTEKYKMRKRKQGYIEEHISRFCNVNSPLHYSIADLLLFYLKNKCSSCQQLLITNGDNSYDPKYFKLAFESYPNNDIFMTDFLQKGWNFTVSPQKGGIDLGGFVASIPFLRKTNSYFHNSIPARADAEEFHDVDGHFVERLVYYGAKTAIVHDMLYTHI
jgi:hypothetical protein